MEVKTFTRVRREENEKETVLRLPSRADIVPSLIMFMLGRSSIAGMYPFVCPFFGASFDKHTAYIGIISMLCGLISAGEGIKGVRFVFAAVVYWLYSYIREDKKNTTMSAVVCAGGVFVCGGMFLPYTNPTIYGVMQLFAESVLTGFLYIAFSRAGMLVRGRETRTQIGQEELICLAICTGGVINGFSGINIPWGIEITRIMTMYTISVISLYASMGTAVIGTVLLGVCTSADMGNALFLVGLYAMCSVFASMMKSFGRMGAVIGFVGGGVMGLLFTGNVFEFPARISELAISAAAFMLTPKKLLNEMGSFLTRTFHSEALRTDLRVKGYLCERLDKLSSSFKSLENKFFELSQRRSDKNFDTVGEMFDAVADKVCKSCGMCRQCWQSNFNDTYDYMFSLLGVIDSRGYCDRANAPEEFIKKCVRSDSFLEELSRMYELYKNRVIWQSENKRARDLVVKQYGEISDVLTSLSFDIRNGFSFLDEMEDKLIETLDREGFRVREVSVIESGTGAVEVFIKTAFGTNIKSLCDKISAVIDMPMEIRGMENGVYRFTSKCEYSVEVGTFQKAKSGEKMCGDSIVHFRTDDNRYCVAICDGMGSGSSAEEESRFSVEMLKEFLKSGISERTAVEIINSSLSLKTTRESFSTIDIFVFDLCTGVCEFIKIGGAESFIKSGGEVEVIFSKTLPVGMFDDVYSETTKRSLKNGDTVIMASDGVTDAGGGETRGAWIKDVLEGEVDMESLAENIVSCAARKNGGEYRDDMTVAAIRVKKTA